MDDQMKRLFIIEVVHGSYERTVYLSNRSVPVDGRFFLTASVSQASHWMTAKSAENYIQNNADYWRYFTLDGLVIREVFVKVV